MYFSGNVALSVLMTAASTFAAVVMKPLPCHYIFVMLNKFQSRVTFPKVFIIADNDAYSYIQTCWTICCSRSSWALHFNSSGMAKFVFG